jgi:anti-anti-sigma factor
MSTDLQVTSRFDGDVCTITCTGELDILSARELSDEIESVLDGDPVALTLDVRGLTLISSAGIELFLDAAGSCYDAGIPYELQVNPDGRQLLDLVGLWWLGVISDGYAAEVAMRRENSDGVA